MKPFPSSKHFKKIKMSTKLMVTNTLQFFFCQIVHSFAFQIDVVYVFVISWHKNAKSTVYWNVIYELSVVFF